MMLDEEEFYNTLSLLARSMNVKTVNKIESYILSLMRQNEDLRKSRNKLRDKYTELKEINKENE